MRAIIIIVAHPKSSTRMVSKALWAMASPGPAAISIESGSETVLCFDLPCFFFEFGVGRDLGPAAKVCESCKKFVSLSIFGCSFWAACRRPEWVL